MKELILKVEQWAQDRNLINGCKPIDQAMKLFSEAGELADNIGKGRDIKDDVGDVLVVMIIISKQLGATLSSFNAPEWAEDTNKKLLLKLQGSLVDYVELAQCKSSPSGIVKRILNILNGIARNHKTTLEECLSVAYNDIKDRKGVMQNGVFIKSTDLAYAEIISSIEDNYSV